MRRQTVSPPRRELFCWGNASATPRPPRRHGMRTCYRHDGQKYDEARPLRRAVERRGGLRRVAYQAVRARRGVAEFSLRRWLSTTSYTRR